MSWEAISAITGILGLLFSIWHAWPDIQRRHVDWQSIFRILFFTAVIAIAGWFGFQKIGNRFPGLSSLKLDVSNPGYATKESLLIINNSDQDIDLQFWTLSNNDKIIFYFQNKTVVSPGKILFIVTVHGTDSFAFIHLKKYQPVWHSGDIITLTDNQEFVRVRYIVP